MEGKTINGYTLRKLLGKGGMAEVWYAENSLGKCAAVKILLEKLCHDEAIVARFQNEAKVMVQLNHPNIRQVYDFCYIDERPCILMEYLEGTDLKALMKSGRRFTNDELIKWWNQIADALKYTHKKGIVHRDIKPSNIFLDENGNIKLLDFGIAKIKESISMTQTGSMMGTLLYMSPEQVKDSKHIGPQSDIYSLAVTFVHLLSGKVPYDTTTSDDYTIRKGIVEIPIDLSNVPAQWQGFLKPYLEKDAEKRAELRHFKTIEFDNKSEETIVEVPKNQKKQDEKPIDKAKQLQDFPVDNDIRFVHISSKRLIPSGFWFPLFPIILYLYIGICGWTLILLSHDKSVISYFQFQNLMPLMYICIIVGLALAYFLTSMIIKYFKRCYKLKRSSLFIEDNKAKVLIITDMKNYGLLNRMICKIILPVEYDKLTWNERNQVYVGIKDNKQILIDIKGHIISQ